MEKMALRGCLASLVLALVFALGMPVVADAATKPRKTSPDVTAPSSVLFIGNSFFYYNNSMHSVFNRLITSADKTRKIRSTSATIGGSGLSWHNVDAYFDPAGVGSYSFVGDNEVVFNDPKRRPFDTAMMLDCSQCPVHPTLRPVFFEYARKHGETIRKHGAEPILYMTWAYADKPDMTEGLAEAYTQAGNENNMLVIPAGLAFAESVKERPDLNLYEPDKRHPSRLGTYLGACTAYAALFKKSPEGINYAFGLDKDAAAFLQKVAWATVKKYYGW
ncbi:MAG: hypothetical protein LBR94_03610 [Desulfovibrio sp.]|nr:hypothetical protein [Desulfovibrio sp.]